MKGLPCRVAVTRYTTFIVPDHQRDEFRRYRKKLCLEINKSPRVVLPPPTPTGIQIEKTPDLLVVDNKRVMNDSLEGTKRDDSKSRSDGKKSRVKQLIQCGGQPSEKYETIAAAELILIQTTSSLSQVQLSFTVHLQ